MSPRPTPGTRASFVLAVFEEAARLTPGEGPAWVRDVTARFKAMCDAADEAR